MFLLQTSVLQHSKQILHLFQQKNKINKIARKPWLILASNEISFALFIKCSALLQFEHGKTADIIRVVPPMSKFTLVCLDNED
jgi:hypothetical protein